MSRGGHNKRTELNETDMLVLRTMANSSYPSAALVAHELFYHVNTIKWRLEKIKEILHAEAMTNYELIIMLLRNKQID